MAHSDVSITVIRRRVSNVSDDISVAKLFEIQAMFWQNDSSNLRIPHCCPCAGTAIYESTDVWAAAALLKGE